MRFYPMATASILVGLLASSCGTKVQHMYYKGDHAGIITEMARKGPLTSMSGIDLFYLCPSLLSQRRYTDFFACCDELEKKQSTEVTNLGQFFTPKHFKAQAYTLRAKAYLETGNHGLSIQYGEKCLAMFREESVLGRFAGMDHFGVEAMGALGVAYAFSDQRANGQEIYQGLADFTILPLRWDAISQDVHYQKARVLMSLKEYDRLMELIESGSKIGLFKGVGSQHGYMDLYLRFMLGKALFMKGRYEEARAVYEELDSLPGMEEQGELFYQIRGDLGRIYLESKMYDKAISYLRQAVAQVELQRSSISVDSAKIGFVGDKQLIYGWLIGALVDMKRPAEAFEYAERAKSRALVDLLAHQRAFGVREEARGSRALYKELQELETRYSSIPEDSVAQRRETRKGLQSLKAQLASSDPELASLVTVVPISTGAVQSHLSHKEAILEYYHQDNRLFGFLVTDSRVEALELKGDRLVEDVRAFRRSIARDGGEAQVRELAVGLYNRLIRPFEGLFEKSILTVVAHGDLHYLPFGALHDGRLYLVDKVAIRMLPSSDVIRFLRGEGRREEKLLILANPDLGDSAQDLIGAELEARRIKHFYPEAMALIRKDASETNFKKSGALFSMIHIAAHGEFNASRPLQSRLLLAPDRDNDGSLTAAELFETRLNADLVVLSACETGLGTGKAGDEVLGFTRAFLYSGARSLVSTLWPVADEETAVLMAELYKNRKTMSKAEALRQAQVSLKKSRPEPFYWAAFVLTGDME